MYLVQALATYPLECLEEAFPALLRVVAVQWLAFLALGSLVYPLLAPSTITDAIVGRIDHTPREHSTEVLRDVASCRASFHVLVVPCCTT